MRVGAVLGDITEQVVDPVVNPANPTPLGGGGVDGAIHRRGGPVVLAACREPRRTRWPCSLPTGEAVATVAGDLPARRVIHAVGPVYDRSQDHSSLLASAYRRSLEVADELGVTTVAFPAISAGAYGRPMDEAARIAASAVRAANTRVGLVRFVLLSAKPLNMFNRAVTDGLR